MTAPESSLVKRGGVRKPYVRKTGKKIVSAGEGKGKRKVKAKTKSLTKKGLPPTGLLNGDVENVRRSPRLLARAAVT